MALITRKHKLLRIFLFLFFSAQGLDAFGGDNLASQNTSCSQRGFSFGPCAKKKSDYAKKLDSEKIAPPEKFADIQTLDVDKDLEGGLHRTAGAKIEDGVDLEKARIKAIENDNKRMADETRARIDEANRRAQQMAAQKAQAERSAAERAEIERQNQLIEEARMAAKKGKPIPSRVVNDSRDPKIKDELLSAAIANDLKIELEEKKKEASINLAKLLQMAAITMQAATAMNSMEGTTPSQSQTFDPTQPVAPKAALAGRSPASLGDKKATISAKSDEPTELADGASTEEKSAKDKETIAKIKAEVEAAEKRKKIYGMRLKQSLRNKLKDKLGKGQAGANAVDTDELFGGSLTQGLNAVEEKGEEELVAKDSALSASSVYQAVKEGFSLAGAETDREVSQIVADAERDLGSGDMMSGVLGQESDSLFERVRTAHQACLRQKCVVAQAN